MATAQLAAATAAMLLRRAIAPALARSLRTPALPRSGASAIASRAYRATPRAAAGYFKHFPTAANPSDTDEFEFTPESEEKIKFALSKFPDTLQGKQSGIMPMLWIVQQQLDATHATIDAKMQGGAFPMGEDTAFVGTQGGGGWVPLAAMKAIAKRLGCSDMDVYEVATFFTMYNREQLGKFHIQLCATTPCMVCGAYDIMHTIEAHLGIKAGETSADGNFTLTEVECLGACANAPMIQINDYFFEDLTPATTVTLLDDLVAGRPVKIGPQNGRVHALGPQGRTCLKDFEAKPYCRELPAPMDQNPAPPAA